METNFQHKATTGDIRQLCKSDRNAMKVPARYNKNSRMDLVKGGFEGAAVGISFFNRRITGAVVKILFAFHLEEKENITRSSWLNCALRNEAVQRGPKV